MIKEIIRDIWLCTDCTVIAVNADYSGLDYSYEPIEAAARAREIDAGLDALPGLVNDSSDEDQYVCNECGFIHTEDHFVKVKDEDDDIVNTCPQCNSGDVSLRDSGEDEFSTSECNCCGSSLGGSRTRFAQLIQEEDHATEI